MTYLKTYEYTCPENKKKVVHTLQYSPGTCTRFPDTVLGFICSRNPECKKCREMYE